MAGEEVSFQNVILRGSERRLTRLTDTEDVVTKDTTMAMSDGKGRVESQTSGASGVCMAMTRANGTIGPLHSLSRHGGGNNKVRVRTGEGRKETTMRSSARK